jgi:DNA-binding winged helix-turn-helix (wHTH) protein
MAFAQVGPRNQSKGRFVGINQGENKSLSTSGQLGNRELGQAVKKQKGSAGNLGRGQGDPPVEPMNDVKNLPLVVRFGAFEVSFELRELRKHGLRLQLEEKPFQILEMLIESAGEVVRRKSLCEKLWPDTYVAFDHSLNTAVNKLRSVLGDLAQNPRFIETRPRLGYRFIAPVEYANGHRPPVVVRRAASAPAHPTVSAREALA